MSIPSGLTSKAVKNLVSILSHNWQAEMTGYYTYQTLAARERDPYRRSQLRTLAQAEQRHASLWEKRIRELGNEPPHYRGSHTGEADSLANRIGGPNAALRRLELEESRDIANYSKQLKEVGDPKSVEILHQVIEDEREHYKTLKNLVERKGPVKKLSPNETKELLEELLSKRDSVGSHSSGWIGDAIYGVNDGLGAIFGIVSGVSGATLGNSKFVLIAGLAGMVASALSMGSGAYLAAKSEREIYEAELVRERENIEGNQDEAHEILSLYYQLKGLPAEDADRMVQHIAQDRERLVKILAAERLSSTEDALKSPWVSAMSGALSTAIGALIPVVPFFFLSGYPAVITAAIVSLIAHFAVGAAKALITVRSWWASGFEMTAIGLVEGIVTYVIGIGLGKMGGSVG